MGPGLIINMPREREVINDYEVYVRQSIFYIPGSGISYINQARRTKKGGGSKSLGFKSKPMN